MSIPKGIEFTSRILCEDVRQDKNNKFILIGVYTGGIIVRDIPAQLTLSFYTEFKVKKKGELALHFRMHGPGEGSAEMEMRLNIPKANYIAAIHSPQMEVLFDSEGAFKIDIKINDGEWFPFIEKAVKKGEVASPFPIVRERPDEQSPPDAPETSS